MAVDMWLENYPVMQKNAIKGVFRTESVDFDRFCANVFSERWERDYNYDEICKDYQAG